MGDITVLAGTNGAGKSSIAGMRIRRRGGEYFNPDEVTRAILARHPAMDPDEANSRAWNKGLEQLQVAIATGSDHIFETTLGGHTIVRTLIEAVQTHGTTLRVWYCGLSSPELHVQRVRARVAAGGHDIAESKIRERYDNSRRNLLRLMPHVTELLVFDNSADADPRIGSRPRPTRILAVQRRRILYPGTPEELTSTPRWAKAIVAMALKTFAE